MITDDEIRELRRKIETCRARDGEQPDHYYACVVVSDLSSVPFDRIFEACLEL